jgi:hypothetical protein
VAPARNSGESALVVDLRRAPVVPGTGEIADGAWKHWASSPAWPASSIACGIGGGRRLEMRGAMMCFGRAPGSLIGCITRQEKVSGGCAVSREDGWKKKGCSRSPAAANLVGGACRCRGGRRAIRAAWGHDLERNQGGNGEEW